MASLDALLAALQPTLALTEAEMATAGDMRDRRCTCFSLQRGEGALVHAKQRLLQHSSVLGWMLGGCRKHFALITALYRLNFLRRKHDCIVYSTANLGSVLLTIKYFSKANDKIG